MNNFKLGISAVSVGCALILVAAFFYLADYTTSDKYINTILVTIGLVLILFGGLPVINKFTGGKSLDF